MEPLSSAATVIASLIVTKAFEKTGEALGEVLTAKLGQFISLIKRKPLPQSQALQSTADGASFTAAVHELERASQSDPELNDLVDEINQAIEADPLFAAKVYQAATLVNQEPSLIQNNAQLAEKIGLVVQGGTVTIESLNF